MSEKNITVFDQANPPKGFRAEPFAWHEELVLRVENLANNGCGIGRIADKNNWVIFIHGTIPGELIRVRIFRNHASYSEADLIEVIEASAERVEPLCGIYTQCGGCQYQHINYEAQLKYKREQVAEIFSREVDGTHIVNPVVASPKKYGYRSKITPHFEKPRNGEISAIGFRQQTRRQLVDVPRCEIAQEEINNALPTARSQVQKNTAKYKRGATLLFRADADGYVSSSEKEVLREQICGKKFEFSAGDFFQNNRYVVELLLEHVRGLCQKNPSKYLVDCYCGCGLFAVALAGLFDFVWGVEINANSVAGAERNFELNTVKNGKVLAAKAEEIFAEIKTDNSDAVVLIDPPRAGCSPEFIEQMLEYSPSQLIYVSCHPMSQLRDLKVILAAGYVIEDITPFDMFPQTKHLECVVSMRRN